MGCENLQLEYYFQLIKSLYNPTLMTLASFAKIHFLPRKSRKRPKNLRVTQNIVRTSQTINGLILASFAKSTSIMKISISSGTEGSDFDERDGVILDWTRRNRNESI